MNSNRVTEHYAVVVSFWVTEGALAFFGCCYCLDFVFVFGKLSSTRGMQIVFYSVCALRYKFYIMFGHRYEVNMACNAL